MLSHLFDKLEVGNVIAFRLEYLEEHRLSFDFAFTKSITSFSGYEMIPLFVLLREFTALESSETFL